MVIKKFPLQDSHPDCSEKLEEGTGRRKVVWLNACRSRLALDYIAILNINGHWIIQCPQPKLFFLPLGLIIVNNHVCRHQCQLMEMMLSFPKLKSCQPWLSR